MQADYALWVSDSTRAHLLRCCLLYTSPQAIVSFGQDVMASTELQLHQSLSFSINAGGGDDPFSAQEQMRTNAPFPTDQWVHVAVTVEPDPNAGPPTGLFGITGRSLARIYIDGVEQARQVFSLAPAALLGMDNNWNPKFTKKYANLNDVIVKAVSAYIEDVKSGSFPGPEHTFH